MLKLVAIAALTVLSGCANFVGNTTMASPEKLKTASTEDLVYGYGYDWKCWGKKNQNIRAELERRAVFSKQSWELIDARQLQQGSSPSVVLAAWGPPDGKAETVYNGSTCETWRYERGESSTLVYFEDGAIKGWTQ